MDEYTKPDRMNAALLTIDTQQDVTHPEAPATIPGTSDAASAMQRVAQQFRDDGSSIVHIVRLYQPDGSNVDLCRRKDIENGKEMVIAGSDGAELVDALIPSVGISLDTDRLLDGDFQTIAENEVIMYKPRWGAFYNTPLEKHLHTAGVNTVVVCGCNFPNCPRTTIYEASERDFRVIAITDAISGLDERGRNELQNIGVATMDATEFRDWFSNGRANATR